MRVTTGAYMTSAALNGPNSQGRSESLPITTATRGVADAVL